MARETRRGGGFRSYASLCTYFCVWPFKTLWLFPVCEAALFVGARDGIVQNQGDDRADRLHTGRNR